MTFRALTVRLYRDFLQPSRLEELRRLLEAALGQGYRVGALGEFWELAGRGARRPAGKHLLLRHDIDTGLPTARRIWSMERSIGVHGSYFFRLSTIDTAFMREIAAAGGETGYHYEELATICKRRRLRAASEVPGVIEESRACFLRNLESLRGRTGLPLVTAAAHGDWINRRLGVSNELMLQDAALRIRAGIALEAYDAPLSALTDRRFADLGPVLWSPGEPMGSIQSGIPVIQLLIHPRQWEVCVGANTAEDARRALEGARYRVGV